MSARQRLRIVSLAAAMLLVAQSEWWLALAVGWPQWIAWAAPIALDCYVVTAVLARRDVGAAMLVSAASVLGSHAVYAASAAWATGQPGQGHLIWPLAAVCSAVPLLVAWRVHHLSAVPEKLAESPSGASDEGAEVPPLLPAVPVESLPAGVVPALSSPGIREAGEPPQPDRQHEPAPRRPSRRDPQPRADVDDLLLLGQAVAGELAHRGEPLTRRALVDGLRARGKSVGTDRAGELLRALRGAA